jgi:hypothetical protein
MDFVSARWQLPKVVQNWTVPFEQGEYHSEGHVNPKVRAQKKVTHFGYRPQSM